MKKILFLAIALAMAVPAKAQETVYIYMQYRQVDASQSAEFERREIEYWSKVAKAAIDKGDMYGWALGKRMDQGGNHNYVFANVFTSMDAFDNNIWTSDVLEALPVSMEEASTEGMSTTVGDMIVQSESYWFNGGNKYLLFNYGKPKDVQGFIDENKELWGPWFERHAKDGNLPTKSWELYRVLAPATPNHATVLTVDGFDTYSEAIMHCGGVLVQGELDGWEDIVSKSKMSEILPEGFRARVIYQRVHSVYAE